jgi:hypothetical protein
LNLFSDDIKVKRGLKRLWIVSSAIWFIAFIVWAIIADGSTFYLFGGRHYSSEWLFITGLTGPIIIYSAWTAVKWIYKGFKEEPTLSVQLDEEPETKAIAKTSKAKIATNTEIETGVEADKVKWWFKLKQVIKAFLLVGLALFLTASLNSIFEAQFDLDNIILPSFIAWFASFAPIWYAQNRLSNRVFAWFLGSVVGLSIYFLWRPFLGLLLIKSYYLDATQVSNIFVFIADFSAAIAIGCSWLVSRKGCLENISNVADAVSRPDSKGARIARVILLLIGGVIIFRFVHGLSQSDSGLFYLYLTRNH